MVQQHQNRDKIVKIPKGGGEDSRVAGANVARSRRATVLFWRGGRLRFVVVLGLALFARLDLELEAEMREHREQVGLHLQRGNRGHQSFVRTWARRGAERQLTIGLHRIPAKRVPVASSIAAFCEQTATMGDSDDGLTVLLIMRAAFSPSTTGMARSADEEAAGELLGLGMSGQQKDQLTEEEDIEGNTACG